MRFFAAYVLCMYEKNLPFSLHFDINVTVSLITIEDGSVP